MANKVTKYSDDLKTYGERLADGSRNLWSKGAGLDFTSHLINNFASAVDTMNQTAYPSYAQFHNAYEQTDLTTDDLNNYLTTLYIRGKLNLSTYKDALNSLEKYEQKYGNALNSLSGAFAKEWFDTFSSGKSKKEIAQLYEAMTEGLDVYKDIDKMSIKDLTNGIYEGIISNAPTVSGIPAPTYNQVRTGEMAGYPVGPVPLWTGQELADLNNTNWNPEYYYDLIKTGTTAAVNRDLFGVNQRDYASTIADDRAKASYLDNIRNVKSEAITTGATRGARAANEMLATRENTTTYADNQNKVRQENYNAMLDSLLADASARLTARDYFTKLAEDRYNEGVQFYTNDTDAQGQELLTDAELSSADVQDRAQANYANALMDQYYAQNAAHANVARGAVNNIANEYAWLFNTFAEANNNNINKTVSDMDQYLFNRYTNQNSLKNFANAVNK